MGILNYSTGVNAGKTVSEIQMILARKGAVAIQIEYSANAQPCALSFRLKVNEDFVAFRLPCNPAGVLQAMKRNGSGVQRSFQSPEQAERTTWRIIKDWVEAQLAIVEAGQAQMGEVFLPYAITRSGQTLFETLKDNPSRLLTAPKEDAETEYV